MTAAAREDTRWAHKAWLRALQATAAISAGTAASLPEQIGQLAAQFGSSTALRSEFGELSYAELADSIQRHARFGLAQGWRPGDVVALLMRNRPQYLAIWLGLSRIGVTVALLNTHLSGSMLAHSINTVAARAVIVDAALAAQAQSARALVAADVEWWGYGASAGPITGASAGPITGASAGPITGASAASSADTPRLPRADLEVAHSPATPVQAAECTPPALAARALYIYTSGTTGLPKAAVVSHRRLLQWSHWFAGMMDVQPEDRMYDCLPMYHSIGGVVATGSVLVRGGTVVLRERFSAHEFWRDVVGERCTLFQYIGELCRYLLAQPPDPQEMRHTLRLCCGNGLRASVWEPFRERFHIPRILEYYAATEGSFSLYNCEGRPGAIGRIPPFLTHRLRVALVRIDPERAAPLRDAAGRCQRAAPDEAGEAIGELGESAPFEGYANREASALKLLRDVFVPGDCWYRTGDVMRQDVHGYFYFVERLGDTFRWKGENISTTEIEAVLMGCPGVRDAAVYGVPVAGTEGRAGMAALVVGQTFSLQSLRTELALRLPRYARPLFLRLVPQLTLTGTFKLSKQQLLAEGYDPALVRDPLYFDDRAAGAYVGLDAPLHQRLQSGAVRL